MLINRVTTLTRSTQKAMSVALIVAAAIAGYGWILSPHLAYLHAVQRYEPAVEDMTVRKNDVCTALGTKRRRLETVSSELATLRVKFFTPTQATAFFSRLEALAEKTGCTVTSVDFVFDNRALDSEASPAQPALALHRAKLTVVGQYNDLIGLFEQLQHRSQEVWIDSCRMELADVRTGKLKCNVTVAISVLAYEEDVTDE